AALLASWKGVAWDRYAASMLAAVLLLAALLGALTTTVAQETPLRGVDSDGIDAMVWIRDNLNPESRFVVLAPSSWETDSYGSWFPAIARMQNIGAVQGYEWLGLDAFAAQKGRHGGSQVCLPAQVAGIERRCRAQAAAVGRGP